MSTVQFLIFVGLIVGYSALGALLVFKGFADLLNARNELNELPRTAAVRVANRRAWTRAVWHETVAPELRRMTQPGGASGASQSLFTS
jgi:hypothetical protein